MTFYSLDLVNHTQEVQQTFYVKGIEELDKFFATNTIPYEYFYKAFGYWILCSLQRRKENKNRYGILTRKLINFSKKLWKKVRSLSERIAKEIKQFQKEPDASRLY